MAILDIDREKHSLRPSGIYLHFLCVSLNSRIIEFTTPLGKNRPKKGVEKVTSTPRAIIGVLLIQHRNTKVYNLQYVCEKQLKPNNNNSTPMKGQQ
jgi:hypothetical protein